MPNNLRARPKGGIDLKFEETKVHKKTELGIIFRDLLKLPEAIIDCPKCHSTHVHDIDFCKLCGCVDRECLECGCTWTEFKDS